MRNSGWVQRAVGVGLFVLASGIHGVIAVSAEPTTGAADSAGPAEPKPVSLDVARDRAKLLHEVYTATLDVMHTRYFHGERAIVPARALEDVFAEIERKSQVKARWIAVNTKAMSISHEPKGEFEKDAAAALAKGESEFEQIEKGEYRRAAPILLHSECVSCHTAFFTQAPKTPRYAGLIIRLPVVEK
jgi:cytochrome c553